MPWFRSAKKFLHAAANGDNQTVIRYINDDRDWLDARDQEENTALHLAIRQRQIHTAQKLLDADIFIDAANRAGDTPLICAVKTGNYELMRGLVEKGADIDVENRYDDTALSVAVKGEWLEAVDFLLQHNAVYDSELVWWALENSAEMACLFFEHGADAAMHNNHHTYPILHAAEAGMDDVVLCLADMHPGILNVFDKDGDTALHCAAIGNHADIVELLVNRGADSTLKNKAGQTAYDIARQAKRAAITKILKPQPAPSAPKIARNPQNDWVKMGDHMIARIGVYRDAGQKLTEIFNFESAERYIVFEDLKTKNICTSPVSAFRDIEGPVVEQAAEEFIAQKGDPKLCTTLAYRKVKKL